MKKPAMVLIAFAIFAMVPFSVFADTIGSARISLTEGDVLYQTMDAGNGWMTASINMPLMSGDRIWVPENARTEIQFDSGSHIRADGNTDLDITRLNRDGKGNINKVALTLGRTYVYCNRTSGGNPVFQLDTPLISATAYNSAIFDVSVYEDVYTEITVIKGTVFVEGQHVNTKVNAGEMISVSADRYAKLSTRRPDDGWLSWNRSRDTLLAGTGASIKYLPSSLFDYGRDLDGYGRWFHTADYGYVWRPRITAAHWAPYRDGRWVWRNNDYVWISYEPWGWVPYHYGRWGFRTGIGWFWVPPAANDVFWGPGFVAWISTPAYVSWVPLAPGEIYYGHGHYGRHSVNVTRVNIRNINVTNIYLNARVAHAVRVVHHDTFVKGKQIKVTNAPANPFMSGLRVSAGRPSVKQINQSPQPLRVVQQKHLPPKRVIESKKTMGLTGGSIISREDNSALKVKTPVSPPPPNAGKDRNSTPLNKVKQGHRVEARTAPQNTIQVKRQEPGIVPPTGSAAGRKQPGFINQAVKQLTQTGPKKVIAKNNIQTRRQETNHASPAKKIRGHEIGKEKKS
jgi:hypothetical protein